MRTALPLAALGYGLAISGTRPGNSFSVPDPKLPKRQPEQSSSSQENIPMDLRLGSTSSQPIASKQRVLNQCTMQRAKTMQWLFRKSTDCLFKTDWSSVDKEIDPSLVERFLDTKLRLPIYYDKALVHGMSPLSQEQAQAEEPSMAVLSITLAEGISLVDLLHQILREQNFFDGQDTAQAKPLSIVDIGCGTGALSKKLLSEHFDQVEHIDGVDASPFKLAKFYQALPEQALSKISLHHMLGENLHALSDNSADRVVISFVFHELPQGVCRSILNEAWRVLRPGGTIHVIDMDKDNPRIKRLGSTSVGNWLIEPYMDSFLKMDIKAVLQRLHFIDSNQTVLESAAPIKGFVARKPST